MVLEKVKRQDIFFPSPLSKYVSGDNIYGSMLLSLHTSEGLVLNSFRPLLITFLLGASSLRHRDRYQHLITHTLKYVMCQCCMQLSYVCTYKIGGCNHRHINSQQLGKLHSDNSSHHVLL